MHPYEVMFVKASWHVGEPHLSKYSKVSPGMNMLAVSCLRMLVSLLVS